jgi:hypothetical protein
MYRGYYRVWQVAVPQFPRIFNDFEVSGRFWRVCGIRSTRPLAQLFFGSKSLFGSASGLKGSFLQARQAAPSIAYQCTAIEARSQEVGSSYHTKVCRLHIHVEAWAGPAPRIRVAFGRQFIKHMRPCANENIGKACSDYLLFFAWHL